MTDTHNRPNTDEQLWAMVFGDETPARVRGAAEFHGLPRICREALTVAIEQGGLSLALFGARNLAEHALVQMAER